MTASEHFGQTMWRCIMLLTISVSSRTRVGGGGFFVVSGFGELLFSSLSSPTLLNGVATVRGDKGGSRRMSTSNVRFFPLVRDNGIADGLLLLAEDEVNAHPETEPSFLCSLLVDAFQRD